MNWDRIEGNWKQLKGRVTEQWGKLTDDDFDVVAGHRDRLDQTLHLMMRAGVRMVFVAGADGALVGMVTAEDLQGERPVVRASSHHVPHSELTVSDVMVPLHRWPTVDLGRVRTARLGEIAATMHEHGLRYLLVTQTKHGQTTLRGLFSASRLERAMQTVIDSDLHSQSFAELEMALATPQTPARFAAGRYPVPGPALPACVYLPVRPRRDRTRRSGCDWLERSWPGAPSPKRC